MSTTSSTTPHRTVKVPHLVAAVVFLGTAATWLLVTTGVLSTLAVPYVVPALLVAAGVLGLVAVAAGARRRAPAPGRVEEPTYDAPHADPYATDPYAGAGTVRVHDPLDELDDLDGTEHTAPVTPTRRFPTTDPTSSTEEDR